MSASPEEEFQDCFVSVERGLEPVVSLSRKEGKRVIHWAQDRGLQSLLNHSINWFGLYTLKVSLAPRVYRVTLLFAKLAFCFLLKNVAINVFCY